MKYLEPSFSTFAVGSDSYRENHDRIFGKKDAAPEVEESECCELCDAHEAESAGSCESSSREAEFAAFDARVAEVEAKVTAGVYDDARVSDTYTPEEALLHALYNWRDELRVFIAQKQHEFETDEHADAVTACKVLDEIYDKAYSGPTKTVEIPYGLPFGCACD